MNVLTLTTPDVENGIGCRVTLWVAGCRRHCPGCHNPHTWSYNQGKPISDTSVLEKIMKEVDKPYIRGITISGGDPLDQDEKSLRELLDFLKKFKDYYGDSKDIWMYTGDVWENLIKKDVYCNILNYIDVLVDGPFILGKKELDLPFRGSTNQRIINVCKSIKQNKVILYEESSF